MDARQRRAAEARARAEATRAEYERRFAARPSWTRAKRASSRRLGPLVAYDFETTSIAEGTPQPIYLTAYCPGLIDYSGPVHSIAHLRAELVAHFLTPELYGARFCAWNGNRFDAFFIAVAMARSSEHRVRPYLTAQGSLRGLRVTMAEDGDKRTRRAWEFLDAISMTGLVGRKLDAFLGAFAPEHRKMQRESFEERPFDPTDLRDQAYARRDSVGLWHGITRAEQIMVDTFGEPLRATIGASCVRVFARHLPEGVRIEPLPADALSTLRRYVMRGGFCHLARPYRGPIWKFDLNQAYAAAMREAGLPDGGVMRGRGAPYPKTAAYMVKLRAEKPGNLIPFYYRTDRGGYPRAVFGLERIDTTWLTDIEHRQLVAEGWRIECDEHIAWPRVFRMVEYVGKLEHLRQTCEGGPSGPIGTMVKAVGNNSYGKTSEEAPSLDFLISADPPPGWLPYYGDGSEPLHNVHYKIDPKRAKAHHQPQLAAWITAHVRMVVRRAALLDPQSWLYADTDCVMFCRDMTSQLDIDPTRYGAWKIEAAGEPYRLIAKKVYAAEDMTSRSAKGLNVSRLTSSDFDRWLEGEVPEQDQLHLARLLHVLDGAEMYRTARRAGTALNPSPTSSRS